MALCRASRGRDILPCIDAAVSASVVMLYTITSITNLPTVCGSCSENVPKKRRMNKKRNQLWIETKQAHVQIKNAHIMFYLLVEHERINVNGNRCSRLTLTGPNATTEHKHFCHSFPFRRYINKVYTVLCLLRTISGRLFSSMSNNFTRCSLFLSLSLALLRCT